MQYIFLVFKSVIFNDFCEILDYLMQELFIYYINNEFATCNINNVQNDENITKGIYLKVRIF